MKKILEAIKNFFSASHERERKGVPIIQMLLKEVHLPMLKLMLFFTTTIALKLKEKSQEKYMKL